MRHVSRSQHRRIMRLIVAAWLWSWLLWTTVLLVLFLTGCSSQPSEPQKAFEAGRRQAAEEASKPVPQSKGGNPYLRAFEEGKQESGK